MIGNKFQKSNTKKKYNSVTTEVDGIKFDSKAESECFQMLKLLERNGQIKILELQPKVYLTRARILSKPDFLIEERGKRVYIDCKGFSTATFKIKKRLWRFYGIGTLRIVKKNGFSFETVEEIHASEGP